MSFEAGVESNFKTPIIRKAFLQAFGKGVRGPSTAQRPEMRFKTNQKPKKKKKKENKNRSHNQSRVEH